MDSLVSFIVDFAGSVWSMLIDSAFLLLIGITLAGVIHMVLSAERMRKLLKGSKNAVVLKASLFGVPLPLCSCSVLPVAHQLRDSGLSKGGTAAFLISTPETGVDSILLTYSLMDPLMTVARPITAFITAMTAGLVVNSGADETPVVEAEPAPTCAHCEPKPESNPGLEQVSFVRRLAGSLKYSYVEMLGELAPYLVIGYLLAGLVAVVVGDNFADIPEFLKAGWGGYLGAIVVGLPLYICATSSTPLAAVLLAAGFSPGAIMVFLLVGPATNVASLTVIRKILGGGSLVRYLITIVIVSVACGLAIDAIYSMLEYRPTYLMGEHTGAGGAVAFVSAVVFSAYVTFLVVRKLLRRFK